LWVGSEIIFRIIFRERVCFSKTWAAAAAVAAFAVAAASGQSGERGGFINVGPGQTARFGPYSKRITCVNPKAFAGAEAVCEVSYQPWLNISKPVAPKYTVWLARNCIEVVKTSRQFRTLWSRRLC
jgi:hypothetical protein